MNKPVGAFEAKTHFSELLECAEHGEEIVITRRGKAVARLVPIATQHEGTKSVRAILKRMKKRARAAGIKSFDWAEWKAYRDEGRP
jgi:prevent-host-death family protein